MSGEQYRDIRVFLGLLIVVIFLWFAWGLWGVEFFRDYWVGKDSVRQMEYGGAKKIITSSAMASGAVSMIAAPSPSLSACLKSQADEAVDKDSRLSQAGQTGDLFGGINALFAAFAFAGVGFAAVLQHRTWRLQVDEKRRLEEEHVRQSFEPLFFKLLERLTTPKELTVPALWLDPRGGYGKPGVIRSFDKAVEDLRAEVRHYGYPYDDMSIRNARGSFVNCYRALYDINNAALGPYFRSLFLVFDLIAKSGLPDEQKFSYSRIARASLKNSELFLLLINAVDPRFSEFGDYISAFSLLRHCDEEFDVKLAKALYEPIATMNGAERVAYWHSNPSSIPKFLLLPHVLGLRQGLGDE